MEFEIIFERKVEVTQWKTTFITAKNEDDALKIAKEMQKRLHIDTPDEDWRNIHEHHNTTNQKVFAINRKRVA